MAPCPSTRSAVPTYPWRSAHPPAARCSSSRGRVLIFPRRGAHPPSARRSSTLSAVLIHTRRGAHPPVAGCSSSRARCPSTVAGCASTRGAPLIRPCAVPIHCGAAPSHPIPGRSSTCRSSASRDRLKRFSPGSGPPNHQPHGTTCVSAEDETAPSHRPVTPPVLLCNPHLRPAQDMPVWDTTSGCHRSPRNHSKIREFVTPPLGAPDSPLPHRAPAAHRCRSNPWEGAPPPEPH